MSGNRFSSLTLVSLLFIGLFSALMLVSCNTSQLPQSTSPPAQSDPEDIIPPYVEGAFPDNDAIEMPVDTEISLHLVDNTSGVDIDSIDMKINGRIVAPSINGNNSDYLVKYKPVEGFSYGELVRVNIAARDLAPVPNDMEYAFTFSIDRAVVYPPVVDDNNNVRLNIIYYGKHTPEIDSLIQSVGPQYLIGNSAHGLWGEVYGYSTWWLLQDVTGFQQTGIKVIGYLTSGYEGTGSGSGIELKWYTLEMNKKLITNMAREDGVDGIFIDECSSYPDEQSKKYLKELSGLAHSYGFIVWGNVGHDDFDDWFFTDGGFDMMNASESWRGQSLTPVQQKWGDKISVTGFYDGSNVEDVYLLIKEAWDEGLAYAYITGDAYARLPSWIEQLAESLREQS